VRGKKKGAKGEEGRRLLRVFLRPRAFLLYRLGRSNFFFEKRHIMLIKLFTIPVGDSGGALQEMNAFYIAS